MDFDTDAHLSGVNLVNTNFGNQIEFDSFGVPDITSRGRIRVRYNGMTYNIRIEVETGSARMN